MGSNQSAVIFGALFVAYFVFITVRGELPIYAGFLLSTPSGGQAGGPAPGVSQVGANSSAASSAAASVTSGIITGAIAAL